MNKIKHVDTLISLYNKNISVYQLTETFKCSSKQIYNILKRNKIHIRNRREAHEKNKKRILVSCDFCKKSVEKILCNYRQSKHHFCNLQCFYSFNTGSNNGNYKTGNCNLSCLIYKLSIYKNWRIKVFKRDNYTCQNCFKHNIYLEAHHRITVENIIKKYNLKIIKDTLNCKFLWNTNNGITLCKSCHNKNHPEKGFKK
jgi:hypothetical protein